MSTQISTKSINIIKRHKMLRLPVVLLLLCFITQNLFAAWLNDPTINTVINPKSVNQLDHQIIGDGLGGAIITWAQSIDANNTKFHIYSQRIDSYGEFMWDSPTELCPAAELQLSPRQIPDGLGGAIIVWIQELGTQNPSNGIDIFAQHINPSGQKLWADDGMAVASLPQSQLDPVLVPDGQGGAIIAWEDYRSGFPQVYVQWINAAGVPQWQSNGILAADVNYGQIEPDIAVDNAGGAIVVWTDLRPINSMNIYMQRLAPNGTRIWGSEGIGICTMVGNQYNPHIVADGIGGGFITWLDGRLGDDAINIYAQRVASNGATLWNNQGIAVTIAQGFYSEPALAKDTGGLFIVWTDGRKQSEDTDIYAQKLSPDGIALWNAGGIAVCNTPEFQNHPAIISDSKGGLFVVWQDFYRKGQGWNIFAQHLDDMAQTDWPKNGVSVCIANDNQINPCLTADNTGGCIIVWSDARSGTYYNIYAQQLDSMGLLGGGIFQFYTADANGNPKKKFAPGELVFFHAYWNVPAPKQFGSYSAASIMVIDSNTDWHMQSVDYNVAPNLNDDCTFDLNDFAILAQHWQDSQGDADLNDDTLTNMLDLQIFCQYWLDNM